MCVPSNKKIKHIDQKFPLWSRDCFYKDVKLIKEGPLTKNGRVDFAQILAIYMKKSN